MLLICCLLWLTKHHVYSPSSTKLQFFKSKIGLHILQYFLAAEMYFLAAEMLSNQWGLAVSRLAYVASQCWLTFFSFFFLNFNKKILYLVVCSWVLSFLNGSIATKVHASLLPLWCQLVSESFSKLSQSPSCKWGEIAELSLSALQSWACEHFFFFLCIALHVAS